MARQDRRQRVTARYPQTEGIAVVSIGSNRGFSRVQFELDRQLNLAWSLVGGYSYTRQNFENQINAELANVVFLGIRYALPWPE